MTGVAARDRTFLRVLDARLLEGTRRAGPDLACRVGCTECCHGPFPIDALDADRLRRGLRALQASDPPRAAAVVGRAQAAWAALRNGFPGTAGNGRLADDDAAREAFFDRHGAAPCPALDPSQGACDLYAHRPSSCRTYGLPVRIGREDLPPCRLCFQGASRERIESCRVVPDPDDAAAPLLREVEDRDGAGETVVAHALTTA